MNGVSKKRGTQYVRGKVHKINTKTQQEESYIMKHVLSSTISNKVR